MAPASPPLAPPLANLCRRRQLSRSSWIIWTMLLLWMICRGRGNTLVITIAEVGMHGSHCTVHLNGSPGFPSEVFVIPSFPAEPQGY
jgi:hypothetical protein